MNAVENIEREEDFCFYGSEDEERDTSIAGITGEVSSYSYTGMSYPCIVFKEGFTCPKHKLSIVSNMVKAGDQSKKDTSLYFIQNGELFKIGSLSGTQIKGFLDLIGIEMLEGFFDPETKLVNGMLYTLCEG